MSKFTDFLNLFKWDSIADAEEEFNIDKALNENWDKIDTKLKTYITNLQANKVDKEDGKNLSTNDYTNKEKEKLNNIESNAQVNLIEKIQKNGIDIDIINKMVNLILTKNDVGLDNVDNTSDIDKPLSNAVITELAKKLDKTSKATSTEAIAGTNNTKYTTPCSVKSAIDKALEGYTPSGGGSGGDTLPIGAILPFSSDTIPNGWLLCDGSVVSRTTYSELFNAIGLNYVEDGVEWLDEERFPLPNPKGRTLVGKDSTDTDFNTLGKTGGEKTHTLTVSELPSHSHVINSFRQYETGASTDSSKLGRTTVGADGGNSTIATGVTGGGQAHNNLQPYLVTNYIIKAKMTVAIEGEIIQETGTASTTNVYSAKAIDNKLTTNITTGQEVATNEYIDGKRVYLKRATFTTPNAVDIWKTMITIPANSEIVNSYQVYETESSKYPFPFSYNNESMQIYYNSNDGTINVKINFNYALNKDGYIIVKYTKNI